MNNVLRCPELEAPAAQTPAAADAVAADAVDGAKPVTDDAIHSFAAEERVWAPDSAPSAPESAPEPDLEPTLQHPPVEGHARDAMVAAIASTLEHEVSQWTTEETDEAPVGVPVPAVTHQAVPTSLFGQWLQQRARETGFGQDDTAERGAAALIDAFLAKGDVKVDRFVAPWNPQKIGRSRGLWKTQVWSPRPWPNSTLSKGRAQAYSCWL